jgi:hypothetical protein
LLDDNPATIYTNDGVLYGVELDVLVSKGTIMKNLGFHNTKSKE